ncbi:hypothetical protein [uncultured Bifidobacterium sp.]|uniref:hypothetical protein n=1 Tax=uncultured Bifidobacterium sp. TaxID=165187 RepID=UPI0028DB63DE|nr:hypothetical protein [uncultured Bifidobacterium sp.]
MTHGMNADVDPSPSVRALRTRRRKKREPRRRGNPHELHRDDGRQGADQFAVGHAREALHGIDEAMDSWPQFTRQAGLSAELIDALETDFHREVLGN